MTINGQKVKGEKFAYDGCHKIYIIENMADEIEAKELDYRILPITVLEDAYHRSCSLRFIRNFDLTKQYAEQFEQAIIEN